jgi:hypothetical protein
MGYACALAWILFVIIIALSIVRSNSRTSGSITNSRRLNHERIYRPQKRLAIRSSRQDAQNLGAGVALWRGYHRALAFGLPFFWTAASSLKSQAEIYTFPPIWFPAVPQFRNYVLVFQLAPFGRFILNTIIVTALSLVGQVFYHRWWRLGSRAFAFLGATRSFLWCWRR